MGTVMRRSLSQAEQVYLERLNTNLIHAQRAMEGAVDFLREQHKASAADGWVLEDLTVGFVREMSSQVISPDELARLEKDPGEG